MAMTYEEAINEIKYLIGDGVVLEHIVVDLPQESIEALKVAIEAIEKQIPKKPIKNDLSYSGYCCPTCKSNVYQLRSHNIYKTPYCIFCGQAIDWSE